MGNVPGIPLGNVPRTAVRGTYVDAARVFRTYQTRVRQKAMLIKKLPRKILDFLAEQTDPKVLAYFTERRLRPLTMLKTDEEKMERFRGMVGNNFRLSI